MPLRALDFESSASTVPPLGQPQNIYSEGLGVRQYLSAALRVPSASSRRGTLAVRTARFGTAVRAVPSDVYGRCIDHVLDMRGVEFFDHLDGCTAVFGDLVNVGPLHEP